MGQKQKVQISELILNELYTISYDDTNREYWFIVEGIHDSGYAVEYLDGVKGIFAKGSRMYVYELKLSSLERELL